MATITKETRPSILSQRIEKYARHPVNCAQATLMALRECHNLETGPILRALSLFPSGAFSSENPCGAVMAGILAIGLAFGSEPLTDLRSVYDNIPQVLTYCRRVSDELGGITCRRIQKAGDHSHDTADMTFNTWKNQRINYLQRCIGIMNKSARIAGEIIAAGKNARIRPVGPLATVGNGGKQWDEARSQENMRGENGKEAL